MEFVFILEFNLNSNFQIYVDLEIIVTYPKFPPSFRKIKSLI